jgi:tRNA (guanosine-2'-O-)-methyltransferase
LHVEVGMSESSRVRRMVEVAGQRLSRVRLAAEHIFHRHNVSALLRSADAFGVADVHLVGDRGFQPSQGPASGAARWLRLHRHREPADAIAAIRDAGYRLWVADLSDAPVPPHEVPVDAPICLWFGAELMGVCEAARAAADGVVTLPMYGMTQSLNLAAAASSALYVVTHAARAQHGAEALLPPAEARALVDRWIDRVDREAERDRLREAALAAWAERLRLTGDPP